MTGTRGPGSVVVVAWSGGMRNGVPHIECWNGGKFIKCQDGDSGWKLKKLNEQWKFEKSFC